VEVDGLPGSSLSCEPFRLFSGKGPHLSDARPQFLDLLLLLCRDMFHHTIEMFKKIHEAVDIFFQVFYTRGELRDLLFDRHASSPCRAGDFLIPRGVG